MCYRLVGFSSSCLQPLTEDHPDVSLLSPNPPTHFLCPQRAAVHREAWPHATHTQPHKHNIPPHTHNTNILTQTFSLSVPTLEQTRILHFTWEMISRITYLLSENSNSKQLNKNEFSILIQVWFGSYLKVSSSKCLWPIKGFDRHVCMSVLHTWASVTRHGHDPQELGKAVALSQRRRP